MFKWLATILTPSVNKAEEEAKQTLSKIQPEKLTLKKELPIPVSKKIEKVVEVEVSSVKVTKAGLSKLTKQGLEDFALATYGVDIDRRKKKDELVKEVLKLSKKV